MSAQDDVFYCRLMYRASWDRMDICARRLRGFLTGPERAIAEDQFAAAYHDQAMYGNRLNQLLSVVDPYFCINELGTVANADEEQGA